MNDLYSRCPPGTVPDADSTENIFLRDVIGSKSDKSLSDGQTSPSLVGHMKALYNHIHDSAKVWPTGTGVDSNKGADPVTVASNAVTPWLHGTITEVLPANTIATWFDIHWLVISKAADPDDYEIRIYSGPSGSETEIGRVVFSRNTVQDRASVYIPVQIPPREENTRISASLACGDGDGASCAIKFYYHTYPDIT